MDFIFALLQEGKFIINLIRRKAGYLI